MRNRYFTIGGKTNKLATMPTPNGNFSEKKGQGYVYSLPKYSQIIRTYMPLHLDYTNYVPDLGYLIPGKGVIVRPHHNPSMNRWTKDRLTTSNDATIVRGGIREQNQHLHSKGIKRYKFSLKDALPLIPFVVAAAPAIGAAAETGPTVATSIRSIPNIIRNIPSIAKAITTPGSTFWANPLTQQVASSTLAGSTVDLASLTATGYTWGENISGMTKRVTGWNPQSKWWGFLLTDMTNPGYYAPYSRISRLFNYSPRKVAHNKINGGKDDGQHLDWSPKDWFEKTAGRRYEDGSLSEYTDADILELKRYVPEYLEIERQAKANGTWLRMPDGSIWTGDPRSWVQLQSMAVRGYNKDVLWSGRKRIFDPTYIGEVWGIRGKGKEPGLQARTYANRDEGVLPLISEDVPITEYDAKGNYWSEVFGPEEGKVYTNAVVDRDISEGAKRIHIDNVKDPGEEIVPSISKFRTGDIERDQAILNSPQNDVILAPGVIRKSLEGNNGAFSKRGHNKHNAFRSLLMPYLGGFSMYLFQDKNK